MRTLIENDPVFWGQVSSARSEIVRYKRNAAADLREKEAISTKKLSRKEKRREKGQICR